MFFLKKLGILTNQQQQLTTEPSSNALTVEPEISSEVLETQDTPVENDLSYGNSTLLSKFLRSQKIYSGPETLYEDEAWAPEYQTVRLFHKQWGTDEEPISSPSDAQ